MSQNKGNTSTASATQNTNTSKTSEDRKALAVKQASEFYDFSGVKEAYKNWFVPIEDPVAVTIVEHARALKTLAATIKDEEYKKGLLGDVWGLYRAANEYQRSLVVGTRRTPKTPEELAKVIKKEDEKQAARKALLAKLQAEQKPAEPAKDGKADGKKDGKKS